MQTADGDSQADRLGERRLGRLCTIDMRHEPREPGGNPAVRAPHGLDTRIAAGEWWARQDLNLRQRRYERRRGKY